MHIGNLSLTASFLSMYNLLFITFMNNDEQAIEHEASPYTFIFEEKDNIELKKNDKKGRDNFRFVILFRRETISVFLHITFTTFAI